MRSLWSCVSVLILKSAVDSDIQSVKTNVETLRWIFPDISNILQVRADLYLIGSQRDTPPAAGAEAALTVAAGSAAAVSELRLLTDITGLRLRPRRLSDGRLLPQLLHLVLVHLKLLM